MLFRTVVLIYYFFFVYFILLDIIYAVIYYIFIIFFHLCVIEVNDMNDVTNISKQSPPRLAPSPVQNYNGIDLLKLICSFLICIIHIDPFPVNERTFPIIFYLQQCICRIAVPFYFSVTGFLLFRTAYASSFESKAKEFIFRILRLYGLWLILLFWGSTIQLWYLPASVVAVMLLYVCYRLRLKQKTIGILALLLFLFGLLGGCYGFLLKYIKKVFVIYYPVKAYVAFFETTRNGIFFGFPFVFLGAALASWKKEMKLQTAVAGLIASLALMVLEVSFLKKFSGSLNYEYYISLLPAAYFLLQLARGIRLKDKPVFKKLRTISFLVYCTHLFVSRTAYMALSFFKKFTGINLLSFHFLITIILVFGISALIVQLSQKPRFKWLRWLYR